jgi:hypothetical protein
MQVHHDDIILLNSFLKGNFASNLALPGLYHGISAAPAIQAVA